MFVIWLWSASRRAVSWLGRKVIGAWERLRERLQENVEYVEEGERRHRWRLDEPWLTDAGVVWWWRVCGCHECGADVGGGDDGGDVCCAWLAEEVAPGCAGGAEAWLSRAPWWRG